MIIPSSSFASFSSIKKPVAGGGGADVTPNAVNWADIYFDGGAGEWYYTEKQITGINQTITLKVQYISLFGSELYYFVSNSPAAIIPGGGGIDGVAPTNLGMNIIANNGTFTVSNNEYVTFGANVVCGENTTITVKNQSDGDSTMDTMNMQQIGEC